MAVYSYAQLEQLWINAGGSRALAPVMAAIAEAESGGNSDAANASGASGLWQILGDPFPGNPFDPGTNARMAVAKYKSQGLGAWTTYTSGAYKAYIQGSTTPDKNVPGSPTAQATLTAAQVTALAASAQSDCLWKIGFVNSSGSGPTAWGWIGAAIHDFMNPTSPAAPTSGGEICIFSKSEMRALIGGAMLAGGFALALPGLLLIAAAAGKPALQAVQPAAQILTRVTPSRSSGPRESGVGNPLRQDEVRRARSNRASLDRQRRADDKAASTDEVTVRRNMRKRADQVSTRVEPEAG